MTAHLINCVLSVRIEANKSANFVPSTTKNTCLPICLLAALSRTPTPTVTDNWNGKNVWKNQPELGAKLIIRHRDKRFVRKHTRVIKRFKLAGVIDMNQKLLNYDADGELNGDMF